MLRSGLMRAPLRCTYEPCMDPSMHKEVKHVLRARGVFEAKDHATALVSLPKPPTSSISLS